MTATNAQASPPETGRTGPIAPPLDDFEVACLDAYFNVRRAALRHTPESRNKDRRLVERFRAHAGKPLWEVTSEDFDRWAAYLFTALQLAHGTQRLYQSAIKMFWKYLTESREIQAKVQLLHQVRYQQVVTSENAITHVHEREGKQERRYFSVEEIDRLFECNAELAAACEPGSMRQLLLWRDRAFFGTMYCLTSRISETCDLNLEDFEPAPWIPELGSYAQARIEGKGHNGSGPKIRMVPVTSRELPDLLEWYVTHVRPKLVRPGVNSEEALFLTQNGTRVTRSNQMHAYKNMVRAAGFDPVYYCTHGIRHSSSTHEVMRTDFEFGRLKAGHEYAVTTQLYTHVPLAHQQETVRTLVCESVA